jgi:hypothetical protein
LNNRNVPKNQTTRRTVMKTVHALLARAGFVLVLAMGSPQVFGQPTPEKIQQVQSDKAGYAAAIVARWEESAREAGRSDKNFRVDLLDSLMKLQPENLLAAGEASSYTAMMTVLATGRAEPTIQEPVPNFLGDNFRDLVYTPVAPCRLVDTRAGGGALAGGAVRLFEVDSSDLTAQGGSSTGCGIPLAVARAVEMTIIAVLPAGNGYLTAWGLGLQPTSSVLNYSAKGVIANTAIIPVVPGGGPDFALFSLATTDVVVDVLGYFAASSATRPDCTTVQSEVVAVPVNVLTNVDAFCGPGRASTGGGYDISEATIAFPGLFVTTSPLAGGWRTLVENHTGDPRNIQTFVRCCRIPGR